MPGHPTISIIVGQGPTVLSIRASGCSFDVFLSSVITLFLSSSLWETA